jgi:transcriptional regulator with XRE-family HTH domain
MSVHTRKSTAFRLLARLLEKQLIDRAQLAAVLEITEEQLAEFERGDREMSLSLQWRFSTVIAAGFAHHSEIKRRALALRAQLIATSAYRSGETTTHSGGVPGFASR